MKGRANSLHNGGRQNIRHRPSDWPPIRSLSLHSKQRHRRGMRMPSAHRRLWFAVPGCVGSDPGYFDWLSDDRANCCESAADLPRSKPRSLPTATMFSP